jgi:hypothetical protein
MLTAEMDAPAAANGHAAEIDILAGFLSSHLARAGCPNRRFSAAAVCFPRSSRPP